jgi:outer membrane protein
VNRNPTRRFSTPIRAAAALTALLALQAPVVYAQTDDSGDWLVRARLLRLDSANKDSTGLNLSVNDKTFIEVDVTRFLTPNWAVELVLTTPQRHDIRSGGANIGSLKHLPPTLLLQYHVTGLGGFRPYVGAGLNYTRISSVRFTPAVVTALNPRLEKSSTGLALQLGVDVPVGGGWLANLDVKKVQIETDVFSGAAKAGTFKIDPVLFSIGLGKRF